MTLIYSLAYLFLHIVLTCNFRLPTHERDKHDKKKNSNKDKEADSEGSFVLEIFDCKGRDLKEMDVDMYGHKGRLKRDGEGVFLLCQSYKT